MSDTQFTPGPWGPDTTIEVRGSAVQIAWLCSADPGSPSDVQARANAHLIASAPDLYEAGKRVLDGLNARIDAADPSAVPLFHGIAELHDALARARGDVR